MGSRLSPTFSLIRFSVSGLMLRFLIHLYLSFVQDDKLESICITRRRQVRPIAFVEDVILFLLCMSSFCIKNQVFIGDYTYVWVFSLTALINESVFMSISFRFYYYSSAVQCEIKDGDTSSSSFVIQDYFSSPRFLFFYIELRIVLSML